MDRKLISAALLLILALQPVMGNARESVAQLKESPLKENYLDEAPVSGRVIAGVTLTGYATSSLLSLRPPVSAAGSSVCVQVMTRDGRYWSENTFQLPGFLGSSPVALEYPSEHETFLTEQKKGDLAVLGSPRECDATDTDTVFLSSTDNDSDAEPVVDIFVNSGRSDTYLAIKNDENRRRPVRCETITEGRRTGYDTICSIKLKELAATPESLDIKIVRRRYERMLPPTEFTLIFPKFD